MAVKLAKEAYFGKALMRNCTVRGTREQPGLPAEKLTELKQFLISLFPKMPKHEFEAIWKQCINFVDQACKSLQKKSRRVVKIHIRNKLLFSF